MSKVYAVRGATTVERDTKEAVETESVTLIRELVKKNDIQKGESVSLVISTTSDITSYYPAAAVRLSGELDNVPLFSCAEPDIKGALPLVIRFLLTFQKDDDNFKTVNVYLNDAKKLRPDLSD